jgi:lysophospholipid acyltransferase (LPLAT)-like uncharacterized protein
MDRAAGGHDAPLKDGSTAQAGQASPCVDPRILAPPTFSSTVEPTTLLFPIARWWLDSLRWNIRGPIPDAPAVYACWHCDLFAAAALFRDRPVSALVSRSRDGETLVKILSGRKLSFLRGSSSDGSVAGARACLNALRSGRSVATTWDGPKGPVGIPKPGAAWMAQATHSPLVPLRFTYGFHLRLGDWSRMTIPLPFTRIRVEAEPMETTP